MQIDFSDKDFFRQLGATLNNATWELIDKDERSSEEDMKMIEMAHASCYFWTEFGGPLNVQRGHWLVSRAYVCAKLPWPCLHHAKICMEITEKQGLKDFDLAFAFEAMARAYSISSNEAEKTNYLEKAKRAGEQIKDSEDKNIFFQELDRGPWV